VIFGHNKQESQHFTLSLQYEQKSTTDMTKDINRIKVVLAEKKRTNKWLAETLGKDPATVSKWCTNIAQPSLETLIRIAECLEVDVKELINSTRSDVMYIKMPK
jgi:transcriptional regulator with XRE-family HTH domain